MMQVRRSTGPLGVPRVLNGAGKMTYLGSSVLDTRVIDAMAGAAKQHVDMEALTAAAEDHIAALVGVPACSVTASAASGLVLTVAASITGIDRNLIAAVPAGLPDRREVVLMKGHAINFGAPIEQMLSAGGAIVRKVGSSTSSTLKQIAEAIGPNTASVVFVVSHHTTTIDEPDLGDVADLAKDAGVSLIVDAAAEVDLRRYVDAGATAVVYSGHKAIGGPTSGLVLGTPGLIDACRAQRFGIGRAMKVSKETLLGLVIAVQIYQESYGLGGTEDLVGILELIKNRIDGRVPADVSIVSDPHRPIPRLRLQVRQDASLSASQLVEKLEASSPSVRTRNHAAEDGRIDIDPRELTHETADMLAAILIEVCSTTGSTGDE